MVSNTVLFSMGITFFFFFFLAAEREMLVMCQCYSVSLEAISLRQRGSALGVKLFCLLIGRLSQNVRSGCYSEWVGDGCLCNFYLIVVSCLAGWMFIVCTC